MPKYTDEFTLTDTPITVRWRGKNDTSVGGGVIPAINKVQEIKLVPLPDSDGNFPTWYVKGTHADSNWATVPAAAPAYPEDGLVNVGEIVQIKAGAGESITMTLHVKGE
jgi:hypothetical protein